MERMIRKVTPAAFKQATKQKRVAAYAAAEVLRLAADL